MKKVWEPSSCPVDDCKVVTRYKEKYDLVVHITKHHGVDKKAAMEMAAYGYVMKLASQVVTKRRDGKFGL